MKRVLLAGAGLVVLAGCGGSPGPVGQNSADSITTTAVGNVVATQPSATPSPTENEAAVVADNAAAASDATTANDVASNGAM